MIVCLYGGGGRLRFWRRATGDNIWRFNWDVKTKNCVNGDESEVRLRTRSVEASLARNEAVKEPSIRMQMHY